MEESLIRLAQLRSVLYEVHTSGDDTLRMANAFTLLENAIALMQKSINNDVQPTDHM